MQARDIVIGTGFSDHSEGALRFFYDFWYPNTANVSRNIEAGVKSVFPHAKQDGSSWIAHV